MRVDRSRFRRRVGDWIHGSLLSEALPGDPHLGMLAEAFGKVGKQICENFSPPALGPKDVG
jgi:hypothetical protein